MARFARGVARHLRNAGVLGEQIVGICLDRRPELIGTMLGILHVGAAYVPLDAAYPARRLRTMLADCRARFVIADRESEPAIAGAFDGRVVPIDELVAASAGSTSSAPAGPATPAERSRLAYVLFTSGSTGRPKGVCVELRQLESYVSGVTGVMRPSPGDALALVQPLTFGSCLTMLFPSLVSGAVLHLVDRRTALDPDAYGDYSERHAIDYLKITPSHLRALLDGPGGGRVLPRKALIVGGEPSPAAWLCSLAPERPGMRVIHHYGSTETTVGVTTIDVDDRLAGRSGDAPLGDPLPGVRLHVLDDRLQPAARGELAVAGGSVARGYLAQPALTATRFVGDPFGPPGSRMFLTGDVVERTADGQLRLLHRRDDVVKVRGHRIELGEIESALRGHPAVREAAAVVVGDRLGEPTIRAWVELQGPAAASGAELRTHAAAELPSYMLPARLLVVPRLPRTTSGKVDRYAMRRIEQTAESLSGSRPAAHDVSRLTALAWVDVGLPAPGPRDDFLELGGDSLRATRVATRLRSWGAPSAGPAAVFDHPVFEDFVTFLAEASDG